MFPGEVVPSVHGPAGGSTSSVVSMTNDEYARLFAYLEREFDRIDRQFDRIDRTFDRLDRQFDRMQRRFDRDRRESTWVLGRCAVLVHSASAHTPCARFDRTLADHEARLQALE